MAAVVAWLAPPTDLDTQDWPACFSCPPGHPPGTWPALPSRDGDWSAAPPATPQPCPLGLASGPLPSPRAEPRAPGPFLLPSLGFHAGRSHSGTLLWAWPCSPGLPDQHLRSLGPFRAPVLGGTSRFLAACVS